MNTNLDHTKIGIGKGFGFNIQRLTSKTFGFNLGLSGFVSKDIIIDSKSGFSGAGKNLKKKFI